MRGGKREGAGRKKGEGSKTIRVPYGCLPEVESIIKRYKANESFDETLLNPLKPELPIFDQNDSLLIEKPQEPIHPDIEEITLGFEKLSRQKRRLLIRKHGSKENAFKAFVKEHNYRYTEFNHHLK